MAAYNVTKAKHAQLAASTADTVTLGGDFASAEVVNRDATAEIFATTDGSTPTVGGDNTFIIRPGQSRVIEVPTAGNTAVKLISSGTPNYSVIGL